MTPSTTYYADAPMPDPTDDPFGHPRRGKVDADITLDDGSKITLRDIPLKATAPARSEAITYIASRIGTVHIAILKLHNHHL